MMQLDRSKLGNSPRVDSGTFHTTVNFAATSPRLPTSPRLGGGSFSTPRLTHHRKDSNKSSDVYQAAASPNVQQGLWSKLWSGGSTSPRPGAGASRRPFYPQGNTGLDHPSTPRLGHIITAGRNFLLRPLFLLTRRGPVLPFVALVLFVLIYLGSGHESTQGVKKRVTGAVRPYIPSRAAAAMNWKSQVGTGKGGVQKPLVGDKDGAVHDHSGAHNPKHDIMAARKKAQRVPHGLDTSKSLAILPSAANARKDGRLLIEAGKKHPIPALMARAKMQWAALKGKQSKNFAGAVKEYVRRYGRRPPKGFDQWYAFARKHRVLLIDEFDLIDKDLKIFRAFPPRLLRARADQLAKSFDMTWGMRIKGGKVEREGPLWNHDRARGVEELMENFVHQLPDMLAVYNGHDGARISIAYEERKRLEDLVAAGQHDEADTAPFWPSLKGPDPGWGYQVFCPPGSAVRAPGFDYGWAPSDSTGFEMPPLPSGAAGTLIDSFTGYMNLCESTQYRHFHATSSWVYGHHPTEVLPLFTPGVQHSMGDIHSLIVEQLDLEQPHDPAWDERFFSALHWRGQTSGPLWDKHAPWRTTQRARLHLLSHEEAGRRKVVLTDENDVARAVEFENYRLNPAFLDTGMIGPAVQCIKEDGTCDEMDRVFQGYDKRVSFDRASLFKYVLDVDGNSWSGRFRRLMLSNAAVVKTTLFPEFWTDWAIPWLHFIPMQLDYSDMWDILAFFRGGLKGEGAHDDLGREIALAGKDWVKQCYRWEDIETYQYRLMLEYGRLYNDGDQDFNGDETTEPVWFEPPLKASQ